MGDPTEVRHAAVYQHLNRLLFSGSRRFDHL